MRKLWPAPATELSDPDLERLYAVRPDPEVPWVCVNFVCSADGAVADGGRSAGLSDPADREVFLLGRDLCDVVLVGSGTARAEDYRGVRSTAGRRARRARAGLSGLPPVAVVSATAAIAPDSRLCTDTEVPPIILTSEAAPPQATSELRAAGAQVLVAGQRRVQLPRALAALAARGLRRINCEGGPGLFAALLAVDAVDELRLTVAPALLSGSAGRITAGPPLDPPTGLRLASVLQAGHTLLLRYLRPSGNGAPSPSRTLLVWGTHTRGSGERHRVLPSGRRRTGSAATDDNAATRRAGPAQAGSSVAGQSGKLMSGVGQEPSPRDVDLVRTAQLGDNAAFDQLVRRHTKRMFRVALRIVGDPAEAEDVVQDAWILAWRGLSRFRGEAAPATWLYRVVSNSALAHLRRRRHTVPLDAVLTDHAAALGTSEADDPEHLALRDERAVALLRAIATLEPSQRVPLVLHELEGMSYEEVAEVLDVNVSSLHSRLRRARVTLLAKLKEFQ